MKFSQVLTELMECRGISAYRIWKDTGISQSVIGKWKSGEKDPSSEYLQKLASYFGVTTDYLLGIKKEPVIKDDYRLSKDEEKFINWYRGLSQEERDAFRSFHKI